MLGRKDPEKKIREVMAAAENVDWDHLKGTAHFDIAKDKMSMNARAGDTPIKFKVSGDKARVRIGKAEAVLE